MWWRVRCREGEGAWWRPGLRPACAAGGAWLRPHVNRLQALLSLRPSRTGPWGQLFSGDESGRRGGGGQQRNPLPPVPAVDREVAVLGEDRAGRVQFGHSDQACVREGHGDIAVFSHEAKDLVSVISEAKRRLDEAASDQGDHTFLPSGPETARQEASLCEHGFAGEQGWLDPGPLFQRPAVIPVVGIHERDQRSRIQDDVPDHSPNPCM